MANIGEIGGTLFLTDKFSGTLKNALEALGPWGKAAAAGVAVASALGAAMAKAAGDAMKMADALDNQSKMTQTSVEKLQVFNTAAEQAGVSSGTITAAIQRMQKGIGDTTKQTEEAFSKLGVSVDNLKQLKPEAQFELIMQRLGGISDPAEKAATSMAIFGRSGASLNALTGDALPKLEAQMQQLGLVIDQQAIAATDKLEESFDVMGRAAEGIWTQFGVGISSSEGLSLAVQKITEWIGQLNTWAATNRETIAAWVDTGVNYAAGAIQAFLMTGAVFLEFFAKVEGFIANAKLKIVEFIQSIVDLPFLDMVPGMDAFREAFEKVVVEGAEKQVAFAEGAGHVAQKLSDAAQGVADFRANLANALETQDAVATKNVAIATSVEEHLGGAYTRAIPSIQAFLTEMDAKSAEFVDITTGMADAVNEELNRITEDPEGIPGITAGVGDLAAYTDQQAAKMADAFHVFGLKTKSEMDQTRQKALEAFAKLKESGQFTAKELDKIWKDYESDRREDAKETKKVNFELLDGYVTKAGSVLGSLGIKFKGFAIAKAVLDAASHVATTIRDIPWPLSIPAVIAAIAEGAAIVAQVKSVASQFRTGTPNLDFMDFQAESTVKVHGREAIIPQGRGHELANEIAGALAHRFTNPESGAPMGSPMVNVTMVMKSDDVAEWFETATKRGRIRVHSSAVKTF